MEYVDNVKQWNYTEFKDYVSQGKRKTEGKVWKRER